MDNDEIIKHLNKYEDVLDTFRSETDRAAAILAASFLEILLEYLLKAKFIRAAIIEEMFQNNGPLATFSSRVQLCYALGYISKNDYQDLNLIRRIRNHFAHNIEIASFEEPIVRDRCNQFAFVKQSQESNQEEYLPQDARSKFLLSVSHLTLKLSSEFRDDWLKSGSWISAPMEDE